VLEEATKENVSEKFLIVHLAGRELAEISENNGRGVSGHQPVSKANSAKNIVPIDN